MLNCALSFPESIIIIFSFPSLLSLFNSGVKKKKVGRKPKNVNGNRKRVPACEAIYHLL